jgi:hypothetical protein
MVKFCSKQVLSSFLLYFLKNSYMQPCGQNCPRAEGHGAKKEVCYAHVESWFFTFFHFFFFAHGFTCDRYDLNVKFLIFFQKILQGP